MTSSFPFLRVAKFLAAQWGQPLSGVYARVLMAADAIEAQERVEGRWLSSEDLFGDDPTTESLEVLNAVHEERLRREGLMP